MITIQSKVRVADASCADILDFMLNCTDQRYQAWWPGTHLAFHTVTRRPGDVGNVVYMDEYVGRRRIKMQGVVSAVVPGKKIMWQFKQLVRLPARLILEAEDDDQGVMLTHTLQAGFKGIGSILDPLLRLYFSDEFAHAMDEHAQTEFPMLGEMLRDRSDHSWVEMEDQPLQNKSTVWGYAVAALLGAVAGGVTVTLAAHLLPKVMGQMMDKMMAEFPRRMMAQMQAAGRDPMEMCQRMMAEFRAQAQQE
ncbi:MAG: hypothetical protein ACP5J4_20985 [Anaerolineae bacterium]